MIDLHVHVLSTTSSSTARRFHHHIRLNREFRADLAWWQFFTQLWIGIGLLGSYQPNPGQELVSDASGSWGYGAWYGTSWFQHPWSDEAQDQNIATKELFPIVMAAAVWSHQWQKHIITWHCINTAVVAVLNTCSCRDRHLMHLLKYLFFYKAYWQFKMQGRHIAGSCNDRANDLSRNNLPVFLSKVPVANSNPTQIPLALPRLLLSQELDWISATWTQLFRCTLNKA